MALAGFLVFDLESWCNGGGVGTTSLLRWDRLKEATKTCI